MTLEIPVIERVEMQVVEDESGVLYLQTMRTGLAIYSLQTALEMGWKIVGTTAAERVLLARHGFKPTP